MRHDKLASILGNNLDDSLSLIFRESSMGWLTSDRQGHNADEGLKVSVDGSLSGVHTLECETGKLTH